MNLVQSNRWVKLFITPVIALVLLSIVMAAAKAESLRQALPGSWDTEVWTGNVFTGSFTTNTPNEFRVEGNLSRGTNKTSIELYVGSVGITSWPESEGQGVSFTVLESSHSGSGGSWFWRDNAFSFGQLPVGTYLIRSNQIGDVSDHLFDYVYVGTVPTDGQYKGWWRFSDFDYHPPAQDIVLHIDNIQTYGAGDIPTPVSELPLLDRMVWNAAPECPFCGTANAVGWAGGPINTRNGNLSYQETDLSIPVAGGILDFHRSYASDAIDFYTTTLGSGWTHNFDMRLHFNNTALPDTVELQAPGGSRLPFFDNGDSTFSPYYGVTAQLSQVGSTYVVTGFNQKVYTFNDLGLLTQQKDPAGNTITFSYNANDQLISASQGNRSLSYAYDGSNYLTTVTDNLNRTVELGYNGNGDLAVVTDTLGLATTYTYSGTTHLLTEVIDPSGKTIEETAYDGQGRAHRQWDGQGNLLVDIQFNDSGNTHVVTENGVVMTHTYDARNTLVNVTFACADGASGCQAGNDIGYDDNFKQESVQDANGNPTSLVWDVGGSNLESVTDALDNQTTLSYDALNNLTQTINALDQTTTYYYDNAAYPTFRTRVVNTLGQTTLYTPTIAGVDGAVGGLLKAELDANGNLTTYTYNDFGQIIEMVQAAGTSETITTRYGYDGVGRLITTTQESATESHTSLNVYDDGDRMIASISNWMGSNLANWTADCDTSAGPRDTNICTRYGYDDAGRTISTTNSLGQTNRTFYNDAGRTYLTVTNYDGTAYNPANPEAALCNFSNPDPEYNLCAKTEYDSFGRVVTTTNSLGQQNVTEYDSLGRVSRNVTNWVDGVFNPSEPDQDIETLYEYDAAGNTIIVTDTLGNMTRTFYDPLNRAAGTVDNWSGSITSLEDLSTCLALPDERDEDVCTLYEYDEVGNTTIVTDTVGRMTRTFYNDLNQMEATVTNWNPATLSSPAACVLSPTNENEENICTLYGYDPAGSQTTTTNALDQTNLTVYDAAHRPAVQVTNWDWATTIDAAGSGCADTSANPQAVANLCTITTYDSLGRRSSTQDATGAITEFDYDGLGRVITTTKYLDSAPITSVTAYDALGNRLNQTDAEGHTTIFTYDSLNRLKTTTSAEGVTVSQAYNASGWVITTTNGLDQATVMGYGALGRQVNVTDAESNTTTYEYDALGNQAAMIDAESIRTTYLYDGLNRLVGVIENDVAGSNPTHESDVLTQYVYDVLGNRVVITNALSYTGTLTTYDILNRPVVVEDALGNKTYTEYNALGYQTVVTNANGEMTVFSYDHLNRLDMVNYVADGETVSYAYDAVGNRLVMTDSLGVTSYDYDDLYRLTSVTDPFTGTVAYAYDDVGNRVQLTYPDNKIVTYAYDDDNRLLQVNDWDSGITEYQYDLAGRLITTTLPNGVVTVNEYDAANRLTSLRHTDSTSGQLVAEYLYELDNVGNRTAVTETLSLPAAGAAGLMTGLVQGEDASADASAATEAIQPPDLFDDSQQGHRSESTASLAASTLPLPAANRPITDTSAVASTVILDGRSAMTSTLTTYPLLESEQLTFDIYTQTMPYTGTLTILSTEIGETDTWEQESLLALANPNSIVLQPGPETGMDTFIDQSYPDNAYGEVPNAQIGKRGGPGSYYPGGPYRSLLQFDLSDIPAGAIVESATLELYAYQYEGSNTFQFYRATSAWDESATWNTSPTYDISTLWGSFSTTTYRQYVKRTIDISDLVSQWHDGTYPNYGFYIKGTNESAWTRHRFYTSDGTDESMRPKLVLNIVFPDDIVLQPGPETGMDTFIDQSYPDKSYGEGLTARIGKRGGPGSYYPGGPYRSLLQFDLSDIPAGAIVESATLELYAYQYEGSNTFQFYRATSAWDESATWNTSPTYDASTLWGSFSTTTYRQYVKRTIDISSLVSQWHDGTYPNFGFYIKGTNESAWTRQWFYTSDGTDESMRPKLIVALSYVPAADFMTTTIHYNYDPLYRLTEAVYTGDITATYSYGYDAVGNMTAYTETVGTQITAVSRTFNAANQLQVTWSDGNPSMTYAYDGKGNLTLEDTVGLDGGERMYTYNQRNLLTRFVVGVPIGFSGSTTYVYDGDGNRLQQVEQDSYIGDPPSPITTTYTNDIVGLSQVLVASDGTTTTHNLFGLDLIGQQTNEQTNHRFLLADGLGSTRTEMMGSTIETVTTYEPYGSLLAQTGTSGTVYGFTGEQHDAATGLLYLRARYYNAHLNQFQSRDPFAGYAKLPVSQNGYSYVHGNPVKYTDPSGHCIVGYSGEVRMNQYPYGTSGICPNTEHWITEAHAATHSSLSELSITDWLNNYSGIYAIIRYFEVDTNGSASKRLERLLHETAKFKIMGLDPMIGVQFGVIIPGGLGLCDTFEDKQYYDGSVPEYEAWRALNEGANGQMSHFLTAVALAYYNVQSNFSMSTLLGDMPRFMVEPPGGPTRSNAEVAIRLIVGHELIGDEGGIFANMDQYLAAEEYHVREFIHAVAFDVAGDELQRDKHLENILYSNPEALSLRPGNSLEDLRLSLKGWRFGHDVKVGIIGSSPNAASWLRSNLTK